VRASARSLMDRFGMDVDLCGLHRLVAKPERNDRRVHASVEKGHRSRVAQNERSDPFCVEGRGVTLRHGSILGYEQFNGVRTERSATAGREQWLVGTP
jgi:hypothetical protein